MQSVLSSWKDIANYLGKGVRTAQRWENEFALPVRRFTSAKDKQSVFAIPAELDAWILLRTPRRPSSEPDELIALRLENEELRAQLSRLESKNRVQVRQESAGVPLQAQVDGSAHLFDDDTGSVPSA